MNERFKHMRWGNVRAGDIFLVPLRQGTSPEGWEGHTYMVVSVDRRGDMGRTEVTVLRDDGEVPPPWSGVASDPWFTDELLARGEEK